jgi:hypothetical protein
MGTVKRLGVACCIAFAGCVARTEVKATPKKPPPAPVYVGDKSCMVQDFESATDLPVGSKNLGWIVQAQDNGQSDETTYIELRKKICALGGDALSQVAWVKEPDDDRPKLRANAWLMP